MPTKIRVLLVVIAMGWAGPSSAALMPPVAGAGVEWLQPTDFIGVSWNDVATICDPVTGVCNGTLVGNELSGWTWAGVDDVNSLFNNFMDPNNYYALGPGPDGKDCSVCVQHFWGAGFFNTNDGFIELTLGTSRTLDIVAGSWSTAYAPYVGRGFGIFPMTTNSTFLTSERDERRGAWFYRDVPTPATIPLLGLGLAALGLSSRKRKVLP